jgi:ankyrin repeat protein
VRRIKCVLNPYLLLLLQVLLDAGADAFAVDESGVNALLLAASCGSAACMQLLLAEGVDADYHNSDLGAGEHALLAAAEGGWVQCVQLLLAAGARVNRTDKEGRTALWVASR